MKRLLMMCVMIGLGTGVMAMNGFGEKEYDDHAARRASAVQTAQALLGGLGKKDAQESEAYRYADEFFNVSNGTGKKDTELKTALNGAAKKYRALVQMFHPDKDKQREIDTIIAVWEMFCKNNNISTVEIAKKISGMLNEIKGGSSTDMSEVFKLISNAYNLINPKTAPRVDISDETKVLYSDVMEHGASEQVAPIPDAPRVDAQLYPDKESGLSRAYDRIFEHLGRKPSEEVRDATSGADGVKKEVEEPRADWSKRMQALSAYGVDPGLIGDAIDLWASGSRDAGVVAAGTAAAAAGNAADIATRTSLTLKPHSDEATEHLRNNWMRKRADNGARGYADMGHGIARILQAITGLHNAARTGWSAAELAEFNEYLEENKDNEAVAAVRKSIQGQRKRVALLMVLEALARVAHYNQIRSLSHQPLADGTVFNDDSNKAHFMNKLSLLHSLISTGRRLYGAKVRSDLIEHLNDYEWEQELRRKRGSLNTQSTVSLPSERVQ